MKPILQLFCFVLLLCSCTPLYYPNQLQTPLLRDKGEATAAISTGTSTFDLQAAYSPIKHVDLLFDFSGTNDKNHKRMQLEGGLGIYKTYNDALHLELLAGGGGGYFKTLNQDAIDEHSKGMFSRYYLQPNVFIVSEFVEAGLATRASFISFRDYGTGIYIEPTLVGRLGVDNIKFQVQAGLSFNVNDNVELDYNPFIFNVGLVYTFRKKVLD